jgi:hypothetical protein
VHHSRVSRRPVTMCAVRIGSWEDIGDGEGRRDQQGE